MATPLSMARVNGRFKVSIDGPRGKIVYDFAVQYEVCLKTSSFKSVKIETSQPFFIR